MLIFEWDENKNQSNFIKHGVSFVEASEVFFDENAIIIDDPDHSQEERREIIIGMSLQNNVIVVCHCCYDDGDDENERIRIISARKATDRETDMYKWRLN